MPLRFHNTLTRKVEPLSPRDPAHVTFYTCGPTVYDDAHIGNFRSFLAADVLRRWIESPLCEVTDAAGNAVRGPRRVTHVMNITDVGHMTDDAEGGEHGEDRMVVAGRRIAEAKKSGKIPAGTDIDPGNPYQIAEFYAGRFLEDARRLGLKVALEAQKDPTLMPRATASVPGMIEIIKRLLAGGFAYTRGKPGSRVVYFSVQKFAAYGRLSGNTLDQLQTGAGGRISDENQAQKNHPADFLLWKEDPRHIMSWEADFGGAEGKWGKGYPGWHIECSVMSASRLRARGPKPLTPAELAALVLPNGEPVIDIHSGGEDNIFPHHECEIAQSACAFNAAPQSGTFAAMWFHPRFLMVESDKMSKSKGNFFTARDLFAAPHNIEPAALRLEIIKTHYRSNANFTMQGLKESSIRLRRWRTYAKYVQSARTTRWQGDLQAAEILGSFAQALSEDLNVAAAVATLDRLVAMREKLAQVWDQAAAGSALDLTEYRRSVEQSKLPTAPMDVAEAARLLEEGRQQNTMAQHWAALHLMDNVLGVIFATEIESAQTSIGIFVGCDADPIVVSRLEARVAARKNKDFAQSDAIRDELAKMGYAIKDVAGGKVEVRRA